MSQTSPLRVLAVEDSADDVALIERALKVGGYAPGIKRVDTRQAMQSAITAQPWDVILADFRLPELTGIEAIAIVRTNNIQTPIIVVSGTIGEEAAVEAMRAGADDYVLKAQLTRLPDIIRRQLTEAGRQQHRRDSEIARRNADHETALELKRLRNALDMLSRGALYVAERLGSDPPADERLELLNALRESASAAGRVAVDAPGGPAADGGA